MLNLYHHIKGAIYGFAIGDALGAATEFLTPENIRGRYGYLTEMSSSGVWQKGETTDDTAMALAVARGILDDPQNPIPHIGEHFLEWHQSKPKSVGLTIEAVFHTYQGDWFAAAQQVHQNQNGQSAGNGSLMRCLPVALAYDDLQTIEKITWSQSKMTHYDDQAAEACVIYNRIAHRVLHGEALHPAILAVIAGTRYASVQQHPPERSPDGYVVNTLSWALHWLLTLDSFSAVIQAAANAGYDADTVAAVAGGLCGLHGGFTVLPEDYVDSLLNKRALDEVSDGLWRLRLSTQMVTDV
ncbi:ADP-ribosyl-[dinitrogen reductase] hydrolase [Alicyclobacillaceae bacterium I2511]|nr:ADP-ribosyl-[dinitrogen reductase] hydrolase [Alicyclobacillaceae bacterium I2511]